MLETYVQVRWKTRHVSVTLVSATSVVCNDLDVIYIAFPQITLV